MNWTVSPHKCTGTSVFSLRTQATLTTADLDGPHRRSDGRDESSATLKKCRYDALCGLRITRTIRNFTSPRFIRW